MKPGQVRGAVVVEPQDKELISAALGDTEGLGPGHPEEIDTIQNRINDEVLPIEFDPSDSRIILSSLELAMGNPTFSLGYVGRMAANATYEAYRIQALEQGHW